MCNMYYNPSKMRNQPKKEDTSGKELCREASCTWEKKKGVGIFFGQLGLICLVKNEHKRIGKSS